MRGVKLLWILGLALCAVSCTDRVNPSPLPADGDDDDVQVDAGSSSGEPDASVEDAGPITPREQVIRVATYNVHLFFDTTCDSGNCGSGDFEDVPSQSEFEERAAEIAAAIEKLDADVIALEEVENQECLDAIDTALKDRGLDYPVAVLGETNFPASVDVAVLARGSLVDVTTHRDTPLPLPSGGTTTFARELLEVRLSYRGVTVDMFAAHFRSKNDDDPERRFAEGKAAGAIVSKAGADHPTEFVVLGGDLNDVPGSEPLEALEDAGGLLRLAADRPLDAQGTYTFNGQNQAIDHLYGAGAARAAYVAGSATSLRDGFGFGGSDHAALRADLKTK